MEHVRYVTVKQEQPQKLFTNHFSHTSHFCGELVKQITQT